MCLFAKYLLSRTQKLTNGENSHCNTYDMGAEISVDNR